MPILASADAGAAGVLNDVMVTALTSGFNQLQGTVGQVLLIAVPVTVACVVLVSGVRFAIKQIKGVLNQAS